MKDGEFPFEPGEVQSLIENQVQNDMELYMLRGDVEKNVVLNKVSNLKLKTHEAFGL